MKRNHSILSLALALALLLGLAPAARAAARPELGCTPGRETGQLQLALEGLDGSGIYGAQVELTLTGEYAGCSFTPYGAEVYSPGCQAAASQGKTEVILYLSGQSPLNNRGLLELGTLSMGSKGGTDSLPRTAQMTLLNRGLEPLTGAMGGDVPVVIGTRNPAGAAGDPAALRAGPGERHPALYGRERPGLVL